MRHRRILCDIARRVRAFDRSFARARVRDDDVDVCERAGGDARVGDGARGGEVRGDGRRRRSSAVEASARGARDDGGGAEDGA